MGEEAGNVREKRGCSCPRFPLAIAIDITILITVVHLVIVEVVDLTRIVVDQLQILTVPTSARERWPRVAGR